MSETATLLPDLDTLDLFTLVAVLDVLPVCALLMEEEDIHCNRAAEQLTGYDRHEISCRSDFFARLFGAGAEQARTVFEADRQAGFAAARDYSVTGKDGRVRIVAFTCTGSGRLLCTLQDVTEQKLRQRALSESEERYRSFSGLTSDYFHCCVRSAETPFRVQWIGGAIEEVTGYTEAEIFGGCWLQHVHPEDRERVATGKMGLRPGEGYTDEFRIVCKDGQTCWIRETCRCEDGDVEGELRLFGASRNITAGKQAEMALQNAEEIFRHFLQYSPAYLVFKDENHKIVRMSKNFETLLGTPLSEQIGKSVEELFPPDLAEQIVREDLKVLREGRPTQTEEELFGRVYSCLKFCIPQGGESQMLVCIKTDITAHKEAEDALCRMNDKLDRRVAERTAELEAAILEQESFSYSVSHDLRAPLRHINSFSAILLETYHDTLPEEARDYLSRICRATRRMGLLIDNLLELSRVSRTLIKCSQVNLSDLAERIALMLKETEPDRVVELVIEPDLHAGCDKILARQLFENLLGNAWKYTSRNPAARIEFGMIPSEQGAVFFVKDNGAGFDMAYKDKLFIPFQRLHGAEFEGNGIGLATAKRIVQRHGGSIWAEGEEDSGARFCFTLC